MTGEQSIVFESYYNAYYTQVYGYILKRIPNASDAEDLAMDAFASCYQKFDTFDPGKASFATWLYVVVNNRLKNYYRDRKIPEELDEGMAVQEDLKDDVVAAEYLDGMRRELAGALDALPEIQRKIVLLKYFKNKNASEIAEIVDMTPVNVRAQLSRAMKKLKTYFLDKNIEWED